ncbi:hypothetical protein HHK36_020101 [Tetracentron sinense]|uniref:Anthocyanin acyltransferase n=1 Tax=Tetracentron sinense TaxID=13715 RepID=A0A835D8I9_TETSI|nr:hypothetical protein HHK36_020101 [Tetracentron sinense]
MAPPNNTITVLELCRVAPPPDSVMQMSLPLSFYDLIHLRSVPIQLVFFFEYPHSKTHFIDSFLPKLKHSLSLTLQHFYPLAGNLTWPPESEKPIILYVNGDSVSLTIAESNNDFHHLSSDHARDINESLSLVPHLPKTDTLAPVLALQVTVFPNFGFSLGISMHHAAVDGLSISRFIKAWASICRSGDSSLSPDFLPFYDRTMIKDPARLEKLYLKELLKPTGSQTEFNNRSLLFTEPLAPPNAVRSTFKLSRADIEGLRKQVLIRCDKGKQTPPLHLTTFVLTCAYVWVCLNRTDPRKKMNRFIFSADLRARLDPPIPITYCGNCLTGRIIHAEICDIIGEEGLAIAVEAFSEAIRDIEREFYNGMEKAFSVQFEETEPLFGVYWSNRLQVYEIDFGWGSPTKVELISIDKLGSMSLSDSRDKGGGVEVGLVLNKQEMEVFASLFANGLNVGN